ncbi:hypothetical protein Tco_0144026 [Tanacetum coccineum]
MEPRAQSKQALKHTNFDIKTAGDHRKVQLNELNELRDHAYENSLIYKEKTKRIHDSKIKNRVFNVGDRVLLFNSRLKIFSGKLKTHWSGPFTVTQVFPYALFRLSQNSRPNFKVNGHRYEGTEALEDCPDCVKTPVLVFLSRVSHPQLHFGNPGQRGGFSETKVTPMRCMGYPPSEARSSVDLQKCEVNLPSRSEMIEIGTPCLEITSFKYCLVNFSNESLERIFKKKAKNDQTKHVMEKTK